MTDVHFFDLKALEAFRADVWGNDHTLTEKSTRSSRSSPVEYLSFGKHLTAVQSFCKAIKNEKLLVVQEYHIAMKEFKSQGSDYSNGACILGQPGIATGKSSFIAYAVIERLREQQPVAVEVAWPRQSYLLFTHEGVSLHGAGDVYPLQSRRGIWAFSDSNEFVEIPTVAFILASGVRIFQTTSPAIKRWKEWTKQNDIELYIMNLWSDEEIEDLAFIFGYDVDRMKNYAAKWGPVPRMLLQLCGKPQCATRLEITAREAISEAIGEPETAVKAIANLDHPINPGSSTVFFIRPLRECGVVYRDVHDIFIPTHWLVCGVAEALLTKADRTKIEFFNVMCRHPNTCLAAGWIFKEFIHRFMVSGRRITIDWFNTELESPQSLILPILQRCDTLADVASSPPVYWRPSTSDYPGIDSVLVTEENVYVIQAAITHSHKDPQKDVDRLWKSIPTNKKDLQWKFLFIGPFEDLISDVSTKYAHNLEIGDYQTTQTQQQAEAVYIPRSRLPVGQVSLLPVSLDFKYFDLPPPVFNCVPEKPQR